MASLADPGDAATSATSTAVPAAREMTMRPIGTPNARRSPKLRSWGVPPLVSATPALLMSPRHSIPHLRRSLALLLPVLASVFAVACGGDGDENQADAEALLDRAFRQSLKSADVKVDARLEVKGLAGFDRPVRIEASGPYIGGNGKLPKLDIDLKIGTQGGGQTIEAGFLSTGDRAFIKFGGQFYEQPRADVARANRRLAQTRKRRQGSLGDLGLSPRDWVVEAKEEGEERVAGVETTHVSGRLDVRRLAEDLNEFVKRSASALGGSGGRAPQGLSKKDIESLAEAVEDPTFDVYVGKEDYVIRRVSADLKVTVPEEDRERLNGIEGGSLRFTVDLGDTNGDQKVEAPARSRPISSLTTQLGGVDALGGVDRRRCHVSRD